MDLRYVVVTGSTPDRMPASNRAQDDQRRGIATAGNGRDVPELLASLFDALRHSVDSPLLWLVVFVVAAANAIVPFAPSRTMVLSVAVLARPYPGLLVLLVVLAAGGALAGDCLGYWIGARAGSRILRRLRRGGRSRRLYGRARRTTYRSIGLLIVAGRNLPGGRTTGALAPGSLGFPFRRFVALDALGASIWAVYCAVVGVLGGAGFVGHPMAGLLVGSAIAAAVSGAIELARRVCPAPAESSRRPVGIL